ncbi:hypothetical protein CA951_42220 [Rhodococcus sp. NCIMB 12038]|nr:hypothetical protein CA951_42220 [Rhodococcus sp. NCIMB 12038]
MIDNGASHRGRAAIDRLAARYPNAVMVHTPKHASGLNQVEIYFSTIQRKVPSPNDFEDLMPSNGACSSSRTGTTPPRWRSSGAPLPRTYTDTSNDSTEHGKRHAPDELQ